MADQQRVIDWLDDVLGWLQEPLTAMPVDRVQARLRLAFDILGSSWMDQRGQVLTQMVHDPPHLLDAYLPLVAEFMAGQYRDCHPLTVWYATEPGTTPQTCGRVPDGLVPAKRRAILMDPLVGIGAEQQLTLYYRRDCAAATFFVLARGGRDFDDDDLTLAGYVQRSLVTLDRQTRVLRAAEDEGGNGCRPDLGLTGRELAVLQLLSDGLSARQTARRLACSPRTVEKHLQHAYRKLEVRDRVNAIRVARLAGVVLEPGARPVRSARPLPVPSPA